MIRGLGRIAIGLSAVAGPLHAQDGVWRPRPIGVVGAALVLGPGVIARGRNAATAGEVLEARWRDGIGLALGFGLEAGWGGGELRILVPGRELDVRNEAGEVFPHHASPPLVWSVGALVYPLPRLGRGLGRRLRPFLAAGAGGMLVSADLDNANGASLYHSWQWTLNGGLRLEAGSADPRAGITVVEVRAFRMRLGAAGPLTGGEAAGFAFALGLRL